MIEFHVVGDKVNRFTCKERSTTLLHTLGINHEKLSVKYQGLDARLTGVEGARVVSEILA